MIFARLLRQQFLESEVLEGKRQRMSVNTTGEKNVFQYLLFQ